MSPKVSPNAEKQKKRAARKTNVISKPHTDSGDSHNGNEYDRPLSIEARMASLNAIYEDSYLDLFHYAQSMIGSHELAHDIVQQAFTNTLSTVEKRRTVNNVGGFLRRCVRNICLDHLKKEHPLSLEHSMPGSREPDHLTEIPTGSVVELRDQCRRVEHVVNGLPPKQRSVFLLVELRGLGYDEVADLMNSSIDSVRQLLFRARRHVRATASKEGKWLGAIPVLGAGRALHPGDGMSLQGMLAQVKEKLLGAQSWLINLAQQAVPALQPSAVFIVGVVTITIAAAPFGQSGPEQEPTSRKILAMHNGVKAEHLNLSSESASSAMLKGLNQTAGQAPGESAPAGGQSEQDGASTDRGPTGTRKLAGTGSAADAASLGTLPANEQGHPASNEDIFRHCADNPSCLDHIKERRNQDPPIPSMLKVPGNQVLDSRSEIATDTSGLASAEPGSEEIVRGPSNRGPNDISSDRAQDEKPTPSVDSGISADASDGSQMAQAQKTSNTEEGRAQHSE